MKFLELRVIFWKKNCSDGLKIRSVTQGNFWIWAKKMESRICLLLLRWINLSHPLTYGETHRMELFGTLSGRIFWDFGTSLDSKHSRNRRNYGRLATRRHFFCKCRSLIYPKNWRSLWTSGLYYRLGSS